MSAPRRGPNGEPWVMLCVAAIIFAAVGVVVERVGLGVVLAGVVLVVALATAVADNRGRRARRR